MEKKNDLLNRGMQCLVQELGAIDAQRFIALLHQENFDYTEWQRQFFDEIPSGEFQKRAQEYAKMHPYVGVAEKL